MKFLFFVAAFIQVSVYTYAKPCDDWCNGQLELGIVLDSSSSISRSDFAEGQKFLQNFLSSFQISPDFVRVSIITYGRTTHPEDAFNLTTYDNNDDVKEAVGLIPHRHQDYTSTGLAIQFMREQQLRDDLVRPGVAKVSLVITDGNSQDTTVTASQAWEARHQNITMLAVGIGAKIDHSELLNIAGDESRVAHVDSYDKLETIRQWVIAQTCRPSNLEKPCSKSKA